MFDLSCFQADCAAIRQQKPIIHNITNYVAMNFAANALLAVGASPLMSFCPSEMEELVTLCGALSVNIGCLDGQLIEASEIAAAKASQLGRPWVLDPVGVGASKLRISTAVRLIEKYHPTVIRGNASEIICLAREICSFENSCEASRGVDSCADSVDAIFAAKILASTTGAVVSVSGPTDYITDGEIVESVTEGSGMMPRVTAMGCTATAITAAFLAVDKDPLRAAVNAMKMMGIAGSRAGALPQGRSVRLSDAWNRRNMRLGRLQALFGKCGRSAYSSASNGAGTGIGTGIGIGTGTFAVRFLDELSNFQCSRT